MSLLAIYMYRCNTYEILSSVPTCLMILSAAYFGVALLCSLFLALDVFDSHFAACSSARGIFRFVSVCDDCRRCLTVCVVLVLHSRYQRIVCA